MLGLHLPLPRGRAEPPARQEPLGDHKGSGGGGAALLWGEQKGPGPLAQKVGGEGTARKKHGAHLVQGGQSILVAQVGAEAVLKELLDCKKKNRSQTRAWGGHKRPTPGQALSAAGKERLAIAFRLDLDLD